MSGALALALLGVLSLQGAGQEPGKETIDERAFVELVAPRAVFYLQELIPLRLRIGYDPEFFETRVIELFRRELDLPLQVEADWLDSLPGTLRLPVEKDEKSAAMVRIALGDRLGWARPVPDEIWDGRRYAVLEVDLIILAERSGVLRFTGPRLHFAYATGFREDLLIGRVPTGRVEATVRGNPLLLRIDPLPEEGRPPGFQGAVGRFTVQASVDRMNLRVGESFRLSLDIQGQGNLVNLEAPTLGRLDGFHSFGTIEKRFEAGRRFVYDLVPLEAGAKLPPIVFVFFDPSEGYRRVYTEPIELQVAPLPEGVPLRFLPGEEGREAIAGENDLHGLKALGPRQAVAPSVWFFAAVLLLPWVVAGALYQGLRARERARANSQARRAARAAAVFHAQVDRGAGLGEALTDYLAARLGISQAAVIGPELAGRLESGGVPVEAARRAASLLDELVAARYGGAQPSAGQREVRALVVELEQSFAGKGSGRTQTWALILALGLVGQAEHAYTEGDFEQAYALYQEALVENGPSGELLYNLGNCAYRLGRHAEAVQFYRRARLRLPRDPEVRFNLFLAEQPLGLQQADSETFGGALLGSFTDFEVLLAAGFLKTVGLLGVVVLRRRRTYQAWMLLALLPALAGFGRVAWTLWGQGPTQGIVVAPVVALRDGPHPDLESVLELRAGQTVSVQERSDRWVRIVHQRGAGWTEREGIGIID